MAGYLWGHYEHSLTSPAAWGSLVFIVVSLLLMLALEIFNTKVELEAKRLTLHMNEKNEVIRLLQEKTGGLERSLDLMAKDNEALRERLRDLAVHQAVEGSKT